MIAVFVAVMLVLIFGFVGLAIDSSHIRATGGQLQDSADAAALAAAEVLGGEVNTPAALTGYPTTRQKAIDMAAANRAAGEPVRLDANAGNSPGGDVVVGLWSPSTRTFVPTTVAPNAVKIVARRTSSSTGGALPLLFGAAFGAGQSDVTRSAIATFEPSPDTFVLVLESTHKGALSMNGNTVLGVGTGKVQVNSVHACAIDFSGQPNISAGAVGVCGNVCLSSGSISGMLQVSASAEPDPLAGILPTTAEWTGLRDGMAMPLGAKGKISATGVFVPGYYPQGLDIKNTTVVTLLPGTYMFGKAVSLTGQSQITGAGVTLLLDSGVELSVGGGAGISVTPPSSGAYQGLALMSHRSTTGSKVLSIGGNGILSFQGTLYVPAGGIRLDGTGAAQVYGQLVCDTLDVRGTSDVTGLSIVPTDDDAPVQLVN